MDDGRQVDGTDDVLTRWVIGTLITAMVLLVAGCATPGVVPDAAMDHPDHHAVIGLRLLEAGEVARAEDALARALALDPASAPAMAGTGLVAATRGDWETAEALLGRADAHVRGRASGTAVQIAWLRYYTLRAGQPGVTAADVRGWVERGEAVVPSAGSPARPDPELYFRLGVLYRSAFRLDDAGRVLAVTVAAGGEYASQARRALAEVQALQRLAVRGPLARRLAPVPRLTRADAVALAVEVLDLPRLVRWWNQARVEFLTPAEWEEQRAPAGAVVPEDSRHHGLRGDIEAALGAGLRAAQPFPDGSFGPGEPLTRAGFALLLEDLHVLIGGHPGLAVGYVGVASPFADVRSDHYAFNAIMVAATRRLLATDARGRFDPTGPVAGGEALLALARLEREARSAR